VVGQRDWLEDKGGWIQWRGSGLGRPGRNVFPLGEEIEKKKKEERKERRAAPTENQEKLTQILHLQQ